MGRGPSPEQAGVGRPSRLARRLVAPLLAGSLLAAALLATAAEYRLPAELESRLGALDDAQRAFLVGDEVLRFYPSRAWLEHELSLRDPEAVVALVTDLMQAQAALAFDPERDLGEIPLNTESERFNSHTIVEPAILREPKRSPGPFGVHRYLYPRTGIPTFAGAPVALTPEDLLVGRVDVAIAGIPNDQGSGRRNAEYGPRVMRGLDTIATPDIDTLIDPMEVLRVVDYGDFAIDFMSTERSIGHVADMVAETAATGAVPMLVGGDTSVLYPGVVGVSRVHGAGGFALVHFGAHPDANRHEAHTISDTQAIFRLLDDGVVRGEDLIQVGLRGPATDAETLSWLREQGVRYHTMAEVRQRGFDRVFQRIEREVRRGPDKLFVSIDVSVIEPTQMIAAGRASVGGLQLEQVTRAIRHLCAARQLVGFELTDMAPMMDYSRTSAMNANAVLNACLVGMAVRRAGLDPDDVNPLAVDHGQD